MKVNKEYILYILIRNDLPSLNAGKAMAQAIHAGHIFSANHSDTKEYKEWAGSLGYGTTITLSANFDTISKLVGLAAPYSGWVTDPTYPIIAPADIIAMIDTDRLSKLPAYSKDGQSVILCRTEKTCAYLFGEKESIQLLTCSLPMYQ